MNMAELRQLYLYNAFQTQRQFKVHHIRRRHALEQHLKHSKRLKQSQLKLNAACSVLASSVWL